VLSAGMTGAYIRSFGQCLHNFRKLNVGKQTETVNHILKEIQEKDGHIQYLIKGISSFGSILFAIK